MIAVLVLVILLSIMFWIAQALVCFWGAAKVVVGTHVTFLQTSKCELCSIAVNLALGLGGMLVALLFSIVHLGVLCALTLVAVGIGLVVAAFLIRMRMLDVSFIQALLLLIITSAFSVGLGKLESAAAKPLLGPVIEKNLPAIAKYAATMSPRFAKAAAAFEHRGVRSADVAQSARAAGAGDPAAALDQARADLYIAKQDADQQFKAVSDAYRDLAARRTKLNVKNAAAVHAYNLQAADYTAQKGRLAATQQQVAELSQKVDEREAQVKTAANVIVYSTSWCPACQAAKQYLTEHNIPFRDVDVEQSGDGAYAFQQLGGTAVPLIVINGEKHTGFDPEWVEQRVKN